MGGRKWGGDLVFVGGLLVDYAAYCQPSLRGEDSPTRIAEWVENEAGSLSVAPPRGANTPLVVHESVGAGGGGAGGSNGAAGITGLLIDNDGAVLINTTVNAESQAMRIRQGGSNANAALSLDSDTGDQSYYRYMRFYRKGQTSSIAKLDIDFSYSFLSDSNDITAEHSLESIADAYPVLEPICSIFSFPLSDKN